MTSLKSTMLLALCLLAAALVAQAPIRGEYFFDERTPYGGGAAFTLANGEADFVINTVTLSEGVHRLFVRVRDQNGHWSQTLSYPVYVKHPESLALVRGEYFFDAPGTPGSGTAISLPAGGQTTADVRRSLPITALDEGLHQLYFRFMDELGGWSQLERRVFWVKRQRTVPIVAGEYFIDVAGDFGTGLPLSFTSTADSALTSTVDLALDLPNGEYNIFFRYRDADGKWSHLQQSTLCVRPTSNPYLATNQAELVVSPNPVRGGFVKLDLQTPVRGTAQVSLYNQLGQVCLRAVKVDAFPEAGYSLPVNQLAPGVYYVTVVTEQGRYRKRVVLQ